jgi:hypothetical protein
VPVDLTKNLESVGSAIASVGTAAGNLFTQLKASCAS